MSHNKNFSAVLVLVLAVFTGILPFAVPHVCAQALKESMALCTGSLLLSLYPFLVVSALLIQCPAAEWLDLPFRPVVRLVGLKSRCAARVLMIGFLGGFAPAARAAAETVRIGQLTAEEADDLLPACVCSGPSFVVLTVGQDLLGSTDLGVCLFAAQILAGYLSAAVLHRCKRRPSPSKAQIAPKRSVRVPEIRIDRVLADAMQNYLKLCGFVLYFRMLAAGIGAIAPPAVGILSAMLLEVCSGCDLASKTGLWASSLCCVSLSLQGLSVLMQIRTLCPAEMTLRPLYQARMLHLPLSLALFYLLMPEGAQSAFRMLNSRVVVMRRVPLDCALLVFAGCCVVAAELTRTLQRQMIQDDERTQTGSD